MIVYNASVVDSLNRSFSIYFRFCDIVKPLVGG